MHQIMDAGNGIHVVMKRGPGGNTGLLFFARDCLETGGCGMRVITFL